VSDALKSILATLSAGRDLSAEQAHQAFAILMAGEATPGQIGAFLMGLRVKGETATEVTAGAEVLRDRCLKVQAPAGAVDVVGTGGDGAKTFNVSTAVAFVLAGGGVPVAKHGNKAASSASGVADVLGALGVKVAVDPPAVQAAIGAANVGFMMAAHYHSAMRHVGPVRTELGHRTIFNMIGPLSNPAQVKRMVVGVADPAWVELFAQALANLGVTHAWVVHGADGLDELTTTDTTAVAVVRDGAISRLTVSPEDAGLPRTTLDQLRGGSPQENAASLRTMLGGAAGAYRDIVLLNAAAGFIVGGQAQTLSEGAALAARSIDSGAALTALESLIKVSNQ